MTEQIDKLEQLARLRATGALTDAEFAAEKAALLAAARADDAETSDAAPTWLRWLGLLAFLALMAGGVVLLARLHGTRDALAEAQQALPPVAEPEMNMTAEEVERGMGLPGSTPLPPSTIQPPTDYLQRCIYAGLSPLGARLGTFGQFLVEKGRRIGWERTGSDWILRSQWHDPLTQQDHEEAFEFQQRPEVQAAPSCDGPLGEIELKRSALDGTEQHELDPVFAGLLHKDSSHDNPDDEPPASTNSAAP